MTRPASGCNAIMKPERWVELEKLYHEIVDLDPAERDRRLSAIPDPDLRREVLSLIQAGPLSSDIAAWLKEERGRVLVPRAAAAAAAGQDAASSYRQIAIHHAFHPGDLLAERYRIVGVLGQGGMGEVYETEDQDMRERVALKVIGSQAGVDKSWVERFRREVQLARRVTHPNVCRVFDLQHHRAGDQDVIFLTMELVRGETLAARLGRAGRLSIGDSLPIAVQLCAALQSAHQAGVLHRDFKCGNVMLVGSGPEVRAVVTDFGTALLMDPSQSSIHTATGALVGTPAYMSPEQLAGKELTPASDIYSLGLVLYEMVTGRRPFESDSAWTEAMKRLNEDPEPPSSVVPEIGAVWNSTILRCVERDPAQRFSSAQEVSDSLEGTEVRPKARMKKWLWAFAAVLVPALVLVFAMVFRAHPTRALTAKDMVVLADFTNNTGEQVFDGTLKEALAIDLEQSPLLNILPDLKLAQVLKLMGRQGGDRLTPDVAREICLRSNSRALIAGSIARLDSHYAIHLKATECQTGNLLGASEAEADSHENTLQALGQAAAILRSKVGESLASVQRFDRPLPEVTTSSLEALQAYSEAGGIRSKKGPAAAIPFFQRAVDLDPNFALAHYSLAASYFNLRQFDLGAENFRRAYELRNRVSEFEKYTISGLYLLGHGDLPNSAQQYQLLIQEYPNSASSHGNLAIIYLTLGQYADAAKEEEQARRLEEPLGTGPNSIGSWVLSYAYVMLDRLDDAKVQNEADLSRSPEDPFLHHSSYFVAVARNDEASMQQQIVWAKGRPVVEEDFLAWESARHAFHGRLRSALELNHGVFVGDRQNRSVGLAAEAEALDAIRYAEFGYPLDARKVARAALTHGASTHTILHSWPGNCFAVATLALVRAGDIAGAETAAKTLAQKRPQDILVQNFWLPTIRAEIAIKNGRAAQAVELLRIAAPYDLNDVGAMASVYARGRAYLALSDGSAAAAEFQKMLDNPFPWFRFPQPLAYVGLARARTLQAHSSTGPSAKAAREQALMAYRNFFASWKDADPDIPILRQAKAEYAKLTAN